MALWSVPNPRRDTDVRGCATVRQCVCAIARRQSASASIYQIVSSDTGAVALSQPPPNIRDTRGYEKLDSLFATLFGVLTCKEAAGYTPEKHLWMRFEQSSRGRRLVKLPQFIPDTKELHRDSTTDALRLPIMCVGFSKRFERPYIRASAEENAWSDKRASLNITLSISTLG
ncbi:MAG TPA: hypothetical protein VGD54_11575 [Steroidobacteraceae bacterium]